MFGFEVVIGSVCCKLDTLVYVIGMVLTGVYLLAGVGAIVWFVLTHSQGIEAAKEVTELYSVMMESVKGSLAVMAGILVVSFIGLLVSLVLVLGVKTEQRVLLLPWQVYHATVIMGCIGGGIYLSLYHTILSSETPQYLMASVSVFPLLLGIIIIFLWVLVHQLNIRLRYRHEAEKVLEEKRSTLVSLTQSLSLPHRSVRSIRTLKRGRTRDRDMYYYTPRSRSMDILDSRYSAAPGEGVLNYGGSGGRSRSLPRKLDWESMEIQRDDLRQGNQSEVLKRREFRQRSNPTLNRDFGFSQLDADENMENLRSSRQSVATPVNHRPTDPSSRRSVTPRSLESFSPRSVANMDPSPHAHNLKGSLKKENSKSETLKRRSKPNLDIFGTADFIEKNGRTVDFSEQKESKSETLKRRSEKVTVVNFQDSIPRPKIKDSSYHEKKAIYLRPEGLQNVMPVERSYMRMTGSNMRQSGSNMRHIGSNMQQEGPNVRQAGSNMRQDEKNIQQTGSNMRQEETNMQHEEFNSHSEDSQIRPEVSYMRHEGSQMRPDLSHMRQGVSQLRQEMPHTTSAINFLGTEGTDIEVSQEYLPNKNSKEEDYRVPTPIYPTFKTGINLTKSDIITMYCRER